MASTPRALRLEFQSKGGVLRAKTPPKTPRRTPRKINEGVPPLRKPLINKIAPPLLTEKDKLRNLPNVLITTQEEKDEIRREATLRYNLKIQKKKDEKAKLVRQANYINKKEKELKKKQKELKQKEEIEEKERLQRNTEIRARNLERAKVKERNKLKREKKEKDRLSKIKPRRPPKGRPFGADNPNYRDPELMEGFKKAKDSVDTFTPSYYQFKEEAERKGITIEEAKQEWDNMRYKEYVKNPKKSYIE